MTWANIAAYTEGSLCYVYLTINPKIQKRNAVYYSRKMKEGWE